MFKVAKPITLPENLNWQQITTEEYVLEAEKAGGRVCFIKLTIRQTPVTELFTGELYVDRDYVEGKSTGSICK